VAAAGYVVGLPDKTVLNRPVYGWTGRVHVLKQRLRIVGDVVTVAHGKIGEVAVSRQIASKP
jgi:hypothetical protein